MMRLRLTIHRHGRMLSLVSRIAVIGMLGCATNAVAQTAVAVTADEALDSGQFTITWTGGGGSYNVHRMGTPYSCNVQTFSAGAQTTMSFTVTSSDDTTFYVVSDTTAGSGPVVSIVTPPSGQTVNTPTVTVQGSVSPAGTPVCVNNKKAAVSGTSFTAYDVPLILGSNTLLATSTLPDGNQAGMTSSVNRIDDNLPPIIQIAPVSDACSPTPSIQVTFSDPESSLNLSSFRAILNGSDVTSSYQGYPTFADPLPPGSTGALWALNASQALAVGTNILRVTIADMRGRAVGDTYSWYVDGPFIDNVTPRSGLPNDIVTITGCGFSPGPGLNTVKFGTVTATVTTIVSSHELRVRVPSSAVDSGVTVATGGLTSNALPFDVAFPFLTTNVTSLGLVVDYQDNVYFAATDRWIRRITPAGVMQTLYQVPEEITGLAIDATRTTIWISSRGAPTAPRRLAGDSADTLYNTAYIRQWPVGGSPFVWATLPATGEYVEHSGPTIAANGLLYTGAVRLVQNPVSPPTYTPYDVVVASPTGFASFSSPLLTFPYSRTRLIQDVSVDTMNNIYVTWCPGTTSCNFYKNGSQFLSGNLGDSVVDCRNNVFLSDYGSGAVYMLDIAGNNWWLISDNQYGPQGMDIDRNGNIYVGNFGFVRRADNIDPVSYPTYRNAACAADFRVGAAGDLDKVYADSPQPRNQFVTLYAVFDPHPGEGFYDLENVYIPPGTRATWVCFDPDDPTTDSSIDPSGPAGNDNQGGMDGKPVFEATAPYTMIGSSPMICNGSGSVQTSIDGNRLTAVRVNLSDAPGDNFTVRVSLTLPRSTGNVTQQYLTQTMTVWKRMKVELDSMSNNVGPFDMDGFSAGVAEDAYIGDIPDPSFGLVAEAFEQAYIEATPAGTGARTDVAFDPHVPDSLGSSNPNLEVFIQGCKGRDFTSTEEDWRLYAQGAYEGEKERDDDPDNTEEVRLFGVTTGEGEYSLVNRETARDVGGKTSDSCGNIFDEAYIWQAMTLHELAHHFIHYDVATCNGVSGVMDLGAFFPYFIGSQLKVIRETRLPSHSPYSCP